MSERLEVKVEFNLGQRDFIPMWTEIAVKYGDCSIICNYAYRTTGRAIQSWTLIRPDFPSISHTLGVGMLPDFHLLESKVTPPLSSNFLRAALELEELSLSLLEITEPVNDFYKQVYEGTLTLTPHSFSAFVLTPLYFLEHDVKISNSNEG